MSSMILTAVASKERAFGGAAVKAPSVPGVGISLTRARQDFR